MKKNTKIYKSFRNVSCGFQMILSLSFSVRTRIPVSTAGADIDLRSMLHIVNIILSKLQFLAYAEIFLVHIYIINESLLVENWSSTNVVLGLLLLTHNYYRKQKLGHTIQLNHEKIGIYLCLRGFVAHLWFVKVQAVPFNKLKHFICFNWQTILQRNYISSGTKFSLSY